MKTSFPSKLYFFMYPIFKNDEMKLIYRNFYITFLQVCLIFGEN